MKTPYLITKKSVTENYLKYFMGYQLNPRFIKTIQEELKNLPENPTPDQVNQAHNNVCEAIGWGQRSIFLDSCYQCGIQGMYPYVVVGENDDYIDTATATLCLNCLKESISLAGKEIDS